MGPIFAFPRRTNYPTIFAFKSLFKHRVDFKSYFGLKKRRKYECGLRPASHLDVKQIALQNVDIVEDAIVITKLDTTPFCCHADLVIMTRPQLVEVAHIFNKKLPEPLKIHTALPFPGAYIRQSIEALVGIREDPPTMQVPQPTVNISKEEQTFSSLGLRRSRNSEIYRAQISQSTRMDHEDEDNRPVKRRRVLISPGPSRPLQFRAYVKLNGSPSPMFTRSKLNQVYPPPDPVFASRPSVGC